MTNDQPGVVQVTKADREAAAREITIPGPEGDMAREHFARAFARHRHAHAAPRDDRAEAVAGEREACAKVAEACMVLLNIGIPKQAAQETRDQIAAAIRARTALSTPPGAGEA